MNWTVKKKRERGRIEDQISEKKKKKKNWRPNQWKKIEEEEDWTQRRKEKKKSKVESCGCGSLYACLITKVPLSYELWKLKTAKICFQFSITHNSKIRELSNGNWVTDHESLSLNKCSSVDPTSFGSWVMKTGWYHSKLSSSKQGLVIGFCESVLVL